MYDLRILLFLINKRIKQVVNADGGGMHISKIIGKGVLDRNANIVGKVDDFNVDISSWTINHLVIKVGLIKKLPLDVDKIDKIGDKVTLKITKKELGKASLV
jgi:sporulation protein YlmC with PRC-barrel domain